ncbi:MAG: sialate O-acetylesterase [Planctomycetes bacterium]|nr:sialate O-acetylesterase [Planctomycetota bacterium]
MPSLGDLLVAAFDAPVGFVACGIRASSVREWLPADVPFANPPTIEARFRRRQDGSWESDGAADGMLVTRLQSLGPRGCRAVLWHRGESDANQSDPGRTLLGDRYRAFLKTLIVRSRRDIGWDTPWMVAQASYHVPGDEGSDDIRAAQAAVAADGIALSGPDSDALKGGLREAGGKGGHFSGPGLSAHAGAWAERLIPRMLDAGPVW